MHIVQLRNGNERRIAVTDGTKLQLINGYGSAYSLALEVVRLGSSVADVLDKHLSADTLVYDAIYDGQSEWRLLPAFDHPIEPARCFVSGTGLTHRASAENRAAMHRDAATVNLTDSMIMYRWGLEGGTPPSGHIGVQPEWFYKGNGSILRAHGEALVVPWFGEDGGEEPEIAGVYVIGADGQPFRVGFTTANEFSDHQMERKNYLYLAPSKLRNCSIGPELVLGALPADISGNVSIFRKGRKLWTKQVFSGEKNMSHSIANLEHHHFKYPEHRRPGDVHVHFFGADAFSFGEGIALEDEDVMEVSFDHLGRPLRNPIRFDESEPRLVRVRSL